jgi:predicted nuclease with TOPRIM domain
MSYTLDNNGRGGKSMSSQSKLRQSRERWKLKASTRADDNRYLRKELARVKDEREQLKKKLKKLRRS